MYGAPTAIWKLFCEFEIFCGQILERGVIYPDVWVKDTGGASYVAPDCFLIGPLKDHSRLLVTFPPKQIVVVQSVVKVDGAYEILRMYVHCECVNW